MCVMAIAIALGAARVLYLFAPLLFSAALSGLVLRYDWLRALRRPIDFHARLRHRRLFGDSKTWRGVLIAVVGSIAAVALQQAVCPVVPAALQIVDYARLDAVSFGAMMGG